MYRGQAVPWAAGVRRLGSHLENLLGEQRHQDEEETPGRGRGPDAKWGVAKGTHSSDKDGGVTFNLSQSYRAECFPLEWSWSQRNVSPSTLASVV